MKKYLTRLIITLTFFVSNISLSYAQTIPVTVTQRQGQGISAQGASAEGIIQIIVLNVITLFFAVGGIGVIIYFIWGTVDWIMSGGDKEKVSNARKKMTHAIIGLFLLALSFAIIRTVGAIAGFDPLGALQLRGLGDSNSPNVKGR